MSCTVEDRIPEQVVRAVDPQGIGIRHGDFYGKGLVQQLGLEKAQPPDASGEPRASLSIPSDTPAMLERLLEQTGCRANLLAICCDGLIRTLRATDRTIRREPLEQVLSSYQPLQDELKYWRASPVKQQAPLDRAVLRAVLLLRQRGAPATAASSRQLLQADGARIPAEDYRQSLDRLELGYLLLPEASAELAGVYPGPRGLVCPVPLIVTAMTQAQDLAAGITDDLAARAEGAE